MGWNSVGNYHPNFRILLTGLPSGDITEYMKFHATLSNFSENATYVRLRIKSNDGESDHYADVNLVDGENNVDLKALAEANPEVDFTNIKDITIWSPGSAEPGKTVDADHPASVKIQNVYLQTVKNVVTCTGLGDEITSLSSITDGTKFVISDGTNVMYFISPDDHARDSKSAAVANVPSTSYFYYTLTKVDGLDLDGNSSPDDNLYIVNIVNGVGADFPNQWGWPNKLNISQYGGIFSARATSTDNPKYGQDYNYGALWKVAYVDDGEHKGFTFQNASTEKPNYLKVADEQADVYYLHLYKSLNFTVNSEFDKENNAANDAIFAFANATGYNAETGEMTDGTWTFATPVDISNWDYLMITTVNNPSAASHEVTITDDNGVSVGGENYSGATAGTGGNMWLDRWNNQNAIRISIDYLRINKSMDITKIKSLRIGGTTKIANVYLTDYNNTYIEGGYAEGDSDENNLKRVYTATGKFGTICLPYVASYSGAEVFSISGKSDKNISLEKVAGLLEAGKPYFYMSADEIGKDNAGAVRNVNFFRADLEKYDVSAPVANNGLIGTFNGIMGLTPGDNIYILSSNMLYNVDAGSTGVKAVNVGANKAYIDLSQITSTSTARSISLLFNEPTGINAVSAEGFTGNGEFYNLQGQRVSAPRKGLYIVNGKVIVIK